MQLLIILLLLAAGSSALDGQTLQLIGDVVGDEEAKRVLSEVGKIGEVMSALAPLSLPAEPQSPKNPEPCLNFAETALAPIKNVADKSVYAALSRAL